MPGLLDSVRNFASKQRFGFGNTADTAQMLNDLDNKYDTDVLSFMQKAGTPPPIVPTGMVDSSQLLRQTNAAAGFNDASQGLNGSMPSLATPMVENQFGMLDPRSGTGEGGLDEEEEFKREQLRRMREGYSQLPAQPGQPASPFGFGFGQGQN
tara:strand:+ start:100 stop:558 length:459 start_codon:yes stop_codon:yes gene_type:complete